MVNGNLSFSVNFNNYTPLFLSSKKRLPALLLCLVFGILGIHRFYVGKIGTGLLWFVTVGLFGIGTLVDLIMILMGKYKDKQGKVIKYWI